MSRQLLQLQLRVENIGMKIGCDSVSVMMPAVLWSMKIRWDSVSVTMPAVLARGAVLYVFLLPGFVSRAYGNLVPSLLE